MHTVIATAVGFVTLGVFMLVAKMAARAGKPPTNAAMAFIGFWLVASLVHLCVGVFVAGFAPLDEIAVHAIIFGLPALLAFLLSRRGFAMPKPAMS